MDIARIKRVIEGAQARDQGRFPTYIAERAPGGTADPGELTRLVDMMRFYIMTAPDMLANAIQWTELTHTERYYRPLFDQIEAYFINPDDEIEDDQHGLFGVLDDAYMALKTVQMIQEAGMPLLTEAHLHDLNATAHAIMGEAIGGRLDARLEEANRDLLTALIRSSDEILSVVAAAAAAPPVLSMDALLFGNWREQANPPTPAAASRRFLADGHFADGNGQVLGYWQADGIVLSLMWHNHTYADYFYEVEGDRLVLKLPGRDATFWEKTA
ncbi:MAG: hypothetical protein U0670_07715 [Anaerolineae bacterium]